MIKESIAARRKAARRKAAMRDTGVPTRTAEDRAAFRAQMKGTGVPLRYDNTGVKDYPVTPVPQSILDDAKDIIYGDREKTYGAPDKNLKAIAGYWANHLNTRFGTYNDITPEDVCIMMVLLKVARLGNDQQHRDSKVDAAGYIALMERIGK